MMSPTTWMRSPGAALLMGYLILPSGAEPFDPPEISFAYGSFTLSEMPQTSSAAIPTQDVPAYVKGTAQDLRILAAAAAMRADLPVVFFINLIQQESSFQRFAVSRAGALGIAQFMPTVASWRGLENPFEPVSALTEAARYLAELRNEFGNLGLAAAAYNAGPTRLRDYLRGRRGLPAETQHYVLAVTGASIEEWTKSADHVIRPTSAQAKNGNTPRAAPLAPRSMPQPSEFAIGKPVRPDILASERGVLAQSGWKLAAFKKQENGRP